MSTEPAPWSIVLNLGEAVALFSTHSNINIRPDREEVLTELRRLARDESHGRVARNMSQICTSRVAVLDLSY